MQGIQITGMGAALPANRVTNEDLARIVDTSDEWIRTRTGIRSRYFSKGETHTQLCTEAARNALEDAGVTPDQIGLCVVATISADYNTPSAASLVQAALGIPEDTPSFDVNAACAGFVYGLNVVSAMLGCGNIERPYALLIGAEQLSRMLNMQDRGTCVLFGDGAAAAVIRRSDSHRFFCRLGSRGNAEALHTPGLMYPEQWIHMDGHAVFRFATGAINRGITLMEQDSGVSAGEIDYIVCHQANRRIIDYVRKRRKLPEEKFFMNLDRYGNTSGASIPLALADMKKAGMCSPGTRMFVSGFGGGLTWASAYLEW
ncbi:MAG: beta-ketoacyl-ACP synthase III [Eubacterium sp.]|jgi:3-oxoacyl-[acyl-carrier-protein] synthase-3|nr:3-oxoacyl-ACP synthase [Lachnospiraceae bacterium]